MGVLALVILAILRIARFRSVIDPSRPPSPAPPAMAPSGDGSSSSYAGGGSLRSGPVEDAADRM
eukprot:7775477-Pyramimonas_sp.AAC.1